MEKDILLSGITAERVNEYWREIKPLIKSALRYDNGKYEVEDIYQELIDRHMQLWAAFDRKGLCAICITKIVKWPRKRIMYLLYIAGRESKKWIHFIEDLKRFAKEHGCDSLEGYGREGWKKLSKPLGFTVIHTVFKFDLS